MIWVRRFFVLPLALIFFVLFLLTLLVFRVNETLLEPGFYKEELDKADVYEFALNDLPTSAYEELLSKGTDSFPETFHENPFVTLSLTSDDVVSSLNKALPPSWIQAQVEQVIDQAGGYLVGERDSFEVTIQGAERVKVTTQEVEALIRKARVYDLLFGEIVTPEIDKALAEEGRLPFKVSLTGEDLVSAVQTVAPENWVKDQVDMALDEMSAYMVGDKDSFEVRVLLSERADVATEEIKTLLKKANFFDMVFNEMVDPMLEGKLASFTNLPFGVSITQEEVSSALRELVPPSWLEEQALNAIDQTSPYLTGKTDSFQVVVPLADRREVAMTIIEDLARSKLNELVGSLPTCSPGQLPFRTLSPSLNELPQCVPTGIDILAIMNLLNVDIIGGVAQMIGSQIPDQIAFTEADLRNALSKGGDTSNLDTLDNVRKIIAEGWTYTDVDLRNDLGEDRVGMLDDVRAALSDGWTYTDLDLRRDIGNAGNGDGEVLNNLDMFRTQFKRARDLRFLVYVLWAVLLALIGLLGGRHWWSKIAWAASVLAFCAAAVFIASGPIYQSIGVSRIEDARTDMLQDIENPTALLAAEKGMDLAQMAVNDFVGGIERFSLVLLVVAVAALVGSVVWSRMPKQPKPS